MKLAPPTPNELITQNWWLLKDRSFRSASLYKVDPTDLLAEEAGQQRTKLIEERLARLDARSSEIVRRWFGYPDTLTNRIIGRSPKKWGFLPIPSGS